MAQLAIVRFVTEVLSVSRLSEHGFPNWMLFGPLPFRSMLQHRWISLSEFRISIQVPVKY